MRFVLQASRVIATGTVIVEGEDFITETITVEKTSIEVMHESLCLMKALPFLLLSILWRLLVTE